MTDYEIEDPLKDPYYIDKTKFSHKLLYITPEQTPSGRKNKLPTPRLDFKLVEFPNETKYMSVHEKLLLDEFVKNARAGSFIKIGNALYVYKEYSKELAIA